MPLWKITYSFRRPNWHAFGRVLFLEADSEPLARAAGAVAAAAAEPGSELTELLVAPCSDRQRAVLEARLEACRRWTANVAAGLPNRRADLP
jgi:hypothetical protein